MGFPCTPATTVAEYVVKNASRLKLVNFHWQGREAFCVSGWLDCNSEGGVMQVLSARGRQQAPRCKQGEEWQTNTFVISCLFRQNEI